MAIALGASGPINFKLGSNQVQSLYQGSDLVWSLATTPLLDVFGPAAGAYSIRKLNSAYTGFCMRVYKESTGTTLDVGFDTNGILNTSAIASFIGAGNGMVKTFYDQSGNGRNLTTTSFASNMPLIVSSGTLIVADFIYNKPAMEIDANRYFNVPQFFSTSLDDLASFHLISRWIQGTTPTSYQNQYIYYPGNSTSYLELLHYNDPAAAGIRFVSAVDRGGIGNAKRVYSDALTNQRSYVIGSSSTLSDLEIWTDGVQSMSVPDGTGTIPPPAASGRLKGFGNLYASRFSEWIVFTRDMVSDIPGISSHMLSYYK